MTEETPDLRPHIRMMCVHPRRRRTWWSLHSQEQQCQGTRSSRQLPTTEALKRDKYGFAWPTQPKSTVIPWNCLLCTIYNNEVDYCGVDENIAQVWLQRLREGNWFRTLVKMEVKEERIWFPCKKNWKSEKYYANCENGKRFHIWLGLVVFEDKWQKISWRAIKTSGIKQYKNLP